MEQELKTIRALRARVEVVVDGPPGATISVGRERRGAGLRPGERRVIRVGGGDSFMGGLIYGLLAFVFVSGVLRSDFRSIAVSLMVWFLYGLSSSSGLCQVTPSRLSA